jgi:tetratricopeptide (TPR) repeat protein
VSISDPAALLSRYRQAADRGNDSPGKSAARDDGISPTASGRDLLDRLPLPAQRPLQECLEEVASGPVLLQDFTPLAESLEWELARLSWSTEGLNHFAAGRVPFLINNNGRYSEAAARVLFANLSEEPPGDEFTIVELGAGSGLFTRGLLTSFAALCEAAGCDWFDRLVYVATDASPRTVEQWRELGLFDEFGRRVEIGLCEATRPESVVGLDGEPLRPRGVRGVIANYVLDLLPLAVLRLGRDGPEQLVVRTNLPRSADLLRTRTSLNLEQFRGLGAAPDPATRAQLAPLLPVLEVQAAFRLIQRGEVPHLSRALECAQDGRTMIFNYGALEAAEGWLARTDPGGFLLINDYRSPTGDETAAAIVQHYGDTVAVGLNFPLLREMLRSAGHYVSAPPGDDERAVHSMLITGRAMVETEGAFASHYSNEADMWFEQPAVEAAELVAAGRNEEALARFQIALARSPRNWQLIGNVAEFVGLQLGEHKAGAELARSALEINPWFSALLWNILGDCLFGMNESEQAHEAYLQALRIAPEDVRTHFNLSFTSWQKGDLRRALLEIAEAIAADGAGAYRDRLLAQQRQIMDAVITRRNDEEHRLTCRAAMVSLAAASSNPRS